MGGSTEKARSSWLSAFWYPPPGGDLDTWRQVLKLVLGLMKSCPQLDILFAGD